MSDFIRAMTPMDFCGLSDCYAQATREKEASKSVLEKSS